jgi:hypothetical protein
MKTFVPVLRWKGKTILTPARRDAGGHMMLKDMSVKE